MICDPLHSDKRPGVERGAVAACSVYLQPELQQLPPTRPWEWGTQFSPKGQREKFSPTAKDCTAALLHLMLHGDVVRINCINGLPRVNLRTAHDHKELKNGAPCRFWPISFVV